MKQGLCWFEVGRHCFGCGAWRLQFGQILTFTQSLLNGEEPPGMSLTKLFTSFPELWEAQREKWGYPDPGILSIGIAYIAAILAYLGHIRKKMNWQVANLYFLEMTEVPIRYATGITSH